MLLMMLERGEQIDDIVFFDWGKEFPEMYAHLEKLEKYIGRSITRFYPPKLFEYYMFDHIKVKGKYKDRRGYGWPSPKIRWCTRIKADTCNGFIGNRINCLGVAYEERFRRAHPQNRYQAHYGVIPRFPLLEWGVAELEALKYCYRHGFDWADSTIPFIDFPVGAVHTPQLENAGHSLTSTLTFLPYFRNGTPAATSPCPVAIPGTNI